ncbi:coiled-coil domain-containing protein 160 isoform X1 [Ambystoma mexicanum]|uniref:coiled-coil domain-containing protein 160 isoform X1 n=1 Tax=Ambystoma mexicanum TaxID=8296 RepID=UPI0037E8C7FB
MAKEEHWVERLFSPHYSVQDFFDEPCQTESLSSEKQCMERAKRVEKIYNLTTKKIQEEEKRKRKDYISKQIVHESRPKPSGKDADNKNVKTIYRGTPLYSGDSNFGSGTEDHEDTCIWTAKELAVLQREMSKKGREVESQRIQLISLNAEIAELKGKLKKTEEAYEKAERDLVLSNRKTTCYAISMQQLEKENFKKDLELQVVREELKEKSKTISSLNKDLQKAKMDIQSLVLQNKDYQKQAIELKQQQEIRNLAFKEKEKLQYRLHLKKMNQEIEAIREEMNHEKLQHARNLGALDLLRKHFSSLPDSKTSNSFKVNFMHN